MSSDYSNLSSRKVPTQARGDKVSGTVSHYRNLSLLELGRLNKVLSCNIFIRSQFLLDFTTSLNFLNGNTSVFVWLPFKNRTPSLFDHFIATNYKLVKIFSAALYSTRYSDMVGELYFSFWSFVPAGIRDRKKDIYSGCRVGLRNLSCNSLARFSTIWRFSLYTGFSYTPSKAFLDFKNVSSSTKSLLFSDLAGVYFLGAGSENLSHYRFSLNYTFPGLTPATPLSSVRRLLRPEVSARVQALTSVLRF